MSRDTADNRATADREAERLFNLHAHEYSLRDWEELMRTLDERIPVVGSPIDFIDLSFEQDGDTSHVDIESREDIAVRVFKLSKSLVTSEDPSERLAQYVRHVEEESITMTSLGKHAQRPIDAFSIFRASAARRRSEEELENLRVIFKADLRSLFDLLCALREKRTPILDEISETNARCGTLRRNVNGEERILIMRGLADFNPEIRSLDDYTIDPDESKEKSEGDLVDTYFDFLHTIVKYNALVAKEVQTIREALANLRGWKSATGEDVREVREDVQGTRDEVQGLKPEVEAAKTAAEGAKESAEGAEQVAKESKSLVEIVVAGIDKAVNLIRACLAPRSVDCEVTIEQLSAMLAAKGLKIGAGVRLIQLWEQYLKSGGAKGTQPPDGYTLATRQTLASASAWVEYHVAHKKSRLKTGETFNEVSARHNASRIADNAPTPRRGE